MTQSLDAIRKRSNESKVPEVDWKLYMQEPVVVNEFGKPVTEERMQKFKYIGSSVRHLFNHLLCISTSERVLRTPFADQNQFFNAKTTFWVIFLICLRYFILKSKFYN